MRKSKLSLLVIAGAGAVFAMAQTAPPTLPPRTSPKNFGLPHAKQQTETRTFYIGGKEYRSALRPTEGESTPVWNSASPLPVALAKAESISREELARFVEDSSGWVVSDFHIGRFVSGSSWYICVTLEPAAQVVSDGLSSDSFAVLMDFRGTVGRIAQVARPR